jgi:hypothetical protein
MHRWLASLESKKKLYSFTYRAAASGRTEPNILPVLPIVPRFRPLPRFLPVARPCPLALPWSSELNEQSSKLSESQDEQYEAQHFPFEA